MQLVSFESDGGPSFGIGVDGGIVDAGRRLAGEFASLRDVLAAGAVNLLRGMEGLGPDLAPEAIEHLPVIADRGAKILCIGVNYVPHIREMGRELPDYPVVFTRFVDSLVGHGRPLVRPRVSEQLDFEGELAVVIGKPARHVPREHAFDYVAGYSCFNDGSVRDFQRHTLQWTPGKNFHASGAFGPWLVTADEIEDPGALNLETRLNGETVQHERLAELCFSIPELIAYCSTWARLEPGDVIATGTPGGVGAARTPPLWLKPGDRIEVEINGLGTLANTVVDETRD